jgi:nucleoside-diphosphate-sugar epimerase
MSKRILITGASGFIGRYCVETFAKHGWETVALNRAGAQIPFADKTLSCDLLDEAQVRNIVPECEATHLLHLAWLSDPATRWTSPINNEWVTASLDLAKAFASSGGQHMLFAGSCAEYEWNDARLVAGQSPLKPATAYGQAKTNTGRLLLAAQAQLGLNIAHARLFFCYGYGEPNGRLLTDLMQSIEEGRPFPTSAGDQKRDYLYAADIAEAFRLFAEAKASGVFNVGSGAAIEVRELVETTAELLSRTDIPQFGVLPRRDGDPDKIEADIEPLRALGFKQKFDLSDGLRDTIARKMATT